MPKPNDRQRETIQSLTDRRLEALASAALGYSPRRALDDRQGTRSNMGGSVNRMVDWLHSAGLHDRDGITWLGVEAVLLNIARVPEPWREDVKAAALKLKPELHARAERKAEEAEALRVQREEAAVQRANERNAAILAKLPQLAVEHGIVLQLRKAPQAEVDAKLIAFWEAVASADMML